MCASLFVFLSVGVNLVYTLLFVVYFKKIVLNFDKRFIAMFSTVYFLAVHNLMLILKYFY